MIKKFAWSGASVAVAMIMAMTMLVQTAQAATLTTAGNVSVPIATMAAAPGTNTATSGTMVLTLAAGDMQNTQTLILTLPGGIVFSAAPTAVLSGPATTLTGVGTAVLSGGNQVATFTATANNNAAAVMTISFAVIPATLTEATGNIAMTGTGVTAIANVGTLTVDTVATGWVSLAPVASVPGNGSSNTTITGIVGTGTGAGAVAQVSKQVVLTSSIAGFGTSGASSTTVFSGATGGFTTTYRGTGTTGTDSITATTPAPSSGVGSVQATLTAAVAGTPTTLTHVNNFATAGAGAQVSNVAPSTSSVTPNYTSPQTGTNVVFRVTDGSSGVNGQVLQVTTDKGGLVVFDGTCTTSSPKAITVTSAATFGGSATTSPGRAGVRFCAGSGSANQGDATITATNISTTMTPATATVTTAGVPATIASTYANGNLEVTVTDANGNPVADNTEVAITIASTVGSAAPATRLTVAGKANFAVALTGNSGNAIVSVNDTAGGTNRLTQSVSLTPSTTPTPSGDGSLTAPSFGTGNVGAAVFSGGTVAQLSAEVTAAGGTSVWAQTSSGTWVRYNTLATGATAFVNNAFNEAFAAGFSGPTAVFVVK